MTTYRPGMATYGSGKKLSQIINEADAIAKNMTLDRVQIAEQLTELGFSQIAFRRDCVVASINGNAFRLGV